MEKKSRERVKSKEGGGSDGRRDAYRMLVTAAVFHPEISPLNDDASRNMYLEVGDQGWAGRSLHAAPPSAPPTQTPVRVRSEMGEEQGAIAASMSWVSGRS